MYNTTNALEEKTNCTRLSTTPRLRNRAISETASLVRFLIAVAMVWAASLHCADAATQPAIKITADTQTVTVDKTLAVFGASLTICANNEADGYVHLEFTDGTPGLNLTPVYAKLILQSGSVDPVAAAVFLPADLDRPAGPNDFVFAVVSTDSTGPVSCDLWDFTGSSVVHGGPIPGRLLFHANATRTRVNARCEPDDFGQFDLIAKLEALPQIVFPLDGRDPFEFGAEAKIYLNNRAKGFANVAIFKGGVPYNLFFGAIIPHKEQGFQFFAVGLSSNPGVPVSTNDLLRIIITEDTSNPECQIWDLLNGDSGPIPAEATFDAVTNVKVLEANGVE